eukprot:COSAG04_NODE_5249_length_1686_cov_2.172549_2_plen_215_part_00
MYVTRSDGIVGTQTRALSRRSGLVCRPQARPSACATACASEDGPSRGSSAAACRADTPNGYLAPPCGSGSIVYGPAAPPPAALTQLPSSSGLSMRLGASFEPNRASTWPSPPMTNFVKFQRMASPTVCGWPCPAGGAASSAPRQNLKTSCVSLPLTSTLEKTVVLSTSRMPRLLINSLISSCVPGSWPPNWLHGNSSVAKLPAPYFFAISVSSL